MAGQGIAPLDPTTPVGEVRAHVGDTSFTPLEPPVAGVGCYEWLSDFEIIAALNGAGGSIPRAVGRLMLGLARDFSAVGRSIKTDDLSKDSRQRGADFIAIANAWLSQADSDDAREAADIFDIAQFGGRSGFPVHRTAPTASGFVPAPGRNGYFLP